MVLIMLIVLCSVGSGSWVVAWSLPHPMFMLGGVTESFVPGASVAQTGKRIALAEA